MLEEKRGPLAIKPTNQEEKLCLPGRGFMVLTTSQTMEESL